MNFNITLKFLTLVIIFILTVLTPAQGSQWEVEEDFDALVDVPVKNIWFADDGMLWRSYQSLDLGYKARVVSWIERVNPNTGQVLNRKQFNERYYNFLPDRSGRVWATTNWGMFLLSNELRVLESRPETLTLLPENRLYNPRLEEIVSYGALVGLKIKRPTEYSSYTVRSNADAGLWLTSSNTNLITLVKVNLDNASFSDRLDFELCGFGNSNILTSSRAILGRCLVDLGLRQTLYQLADNESIVASTNDNQQLRILTRLGNEIKLISGQTGSVIWAATAPLEAVTSFLGDTVLVRQFSNLKGYNISDGQQRFNIELPFGSNSLFGNSTHFVTSTPTGTNVYSTATGILQRTIPPTQFVPPATAAQIAYTDDAVYVSSIFLKNPAESIAQLSKRSRLNGQLLWRKSYSRSESSIAGCEYCGNPGSQISVSNSGVSWSIQLPAGTAGALHSAAISVNPVDGTSYWERGSTIPLSSGSGEFFSSDDLGNGAILLRHYGGGISTFEVRNAQTGQLHWSTTGNVVLKPTFGGDLLKESSGTIERLDGLTGMPRWSNLSPDLSENYRYAMTQEELIYKPTSAIWNPIVNGQVVINRISFQTGLIKPQTVFIPSPYVAAYGPVVQYGFAPGPSNTPIYVRLSAPNGSAAFLIVPPMGTPLLIPSNGEWSAINRQRGLGRRVYSASNWYENYEGGAGQTPYWMDEIDMSGVKNWWQPDPPARLFDSHRIVEDYVATSLSSKRIFLEREYDGLKTKYIVSQTLPIESPLARVALSITRANLGLTERGELKYNLRVTNSSPNAANNAKVYSELAHVNAFHCVATNGTCEFDQTFGILNATLNLQPGGFADIEVLDTSGVRSNAIWVVPSARQIEGNIDDNMVFIGGEDAFTNGFE